MYHVYKYDNTILLAYCFSQNKNVVKKIELIKKKTKKMAVFLKRKLTVLSKN